MWYVHIDEKGIYASNKYTNICKDILGDIWYVKRDIRGYLEYLQKYIEYIVRDSSPFLYLGKVLSGFITTTMSELRNTNSWNTCFMYSLPKDSLLYPRLSSHRQPLTKAQRFRVWEPQRDSSSVVMTRRWPYDQKLADQILSIRRLTNQIMVKFSIRLK